MSVSLTKRGDGSLALIIDGDLQFDSRDERIYHECLVLPALAVAARRIKRQLNVLVIGGGDGLCARELLKSKQVEVLDLVDRDPRVLAFAKNEIAEINCRSLQDPRTKVHVEDAWDFLHRAFENGKTFDVIISDLTTPQNKDEARLHSIEWYAKLKAVLSREGVVAVNSASPSESPQAYWSIFNSALTARLLPRPYRISLPSFTAQGYGLDWGFLLASAQAIEKAELDDDLLLPEPRFVLKSPDQLRRLFIFPQEVASRQSVSLPVGTGSEILVHYFNNGLGVENLSGRAWNGLEQDVSTMIPPKPDNGAWLLPPEIRSALSCAIATPSEEVALLEQVLELMPALNRHQTREMIADFVRDPNSFLQSIDLLALIEKLLQRAGELPQKIVEELKHLHRFLVELPGEPERILDLGMRVLTVICLVVVVGNLLYPDAAYSKAGHGGHAGGHAGGHPGGHSGAHPGAHPGGRGDDHGAPGRGAPGRGAPGRGAPGRGAPGRAGGDRGFGRGAGDRGFGRGYTGYHNFQNRWSNWGHWNHWGNWGNWGWARPGYSWWYTPWWGYGYPLGGGYVNFNFGGGQSIDEQGNLYPARQYAMSQSSSGPEVISTGVPVQSDFRLNSGADILPDGKVAIPLAEGSYMLLSEAGTQIMDQSTGKSVMSLYNDPAQIRQISLEIRRQRRDLNRAIQKKNNQDAQADDQGTQYQSAGNGSDQEVQNLHSTIELLNKSLRTLGQPLVLAKGVAISETEGKLPAHEADEPAAQAPQETLGPTPPPAPGAVEIMSSVWSLPDSRYLVLKRSDGSLAYMDGKNWYSDQGKTPISEPYPSGFKKIVSAYLSDIVHGSDSAKESLLKDKQDAHEELAALNQDLEDYQTAQSTAQPDEKINFGSEKIPLGEAIRRTQMHIKFTQKRMEAAQKQLAELPAETAIESKLLASL